MNIIKTGWASCSNFLNANSPYIMTGIGVAGIFITVWRAITDTFKAEEALEEKQEELGREDLTFKEKFVAVAPCYISTAVSAVASAGLVIGGSVVGGRRLAALAGLYELSDQTVKKYQEVIREKLSEDEAAEVTRRVKGTQRLESGEEAIVVKADDKDTQIWFFDEFGQRFQASWSDIFEADAFICRLVMDQCCASVNDFYEKLQSLGVNVETSYIGDACEWTVEYPPRISEIYSRCDRIVDCKMIDGIPHIPLEYHTDPRTRWSR